MSINTATKIVEIVRDGGGSVVGRTRLQKIAYLLTVTGNESGLTFSYKHYGPFSEEVASAARNAHLLGKMQEVEQVANWGGSYSIYSVSEPTKATVSASRRLLATMAASADAIELELAATAVFLAKEGHQDPWAETARRKPEKSDNGKIEKAKQLLVRFRLRKRL